MSLDARRTMVLDFLAQTQSGMQMLRSPRETLGHPFDSARDAGLETVRGDDHADVDAALDGFLQKTGAIAVGTDVLGRGGMGIVRLGRQTRLAREVAVKGVNEVVQGDVVARRRLVQEALLTATLEHPGIVPVYDVDVDDQGTPLVALKRLEGTPWSQLLNDEAAARARGSADLLEGNLRVLTVLCDALDFAHSRKIIHRDVKPANVMIGAFGEVTLIDWGLAVSIDPSPGRPLPRVADSATIVGTPAYMPPELLERDVGRQGPTTDVYLLGAVLYEVLTGEPPHRGQDLVALLDSVLHGPPPLPTSTPPALAQLVGRCMAVDPTERPASCRDVKTALTDFLAHRATATIVGAALAVTAELEALARNPARVDDAVTRAVRLFTEARFAFEQARAAGGDGDVIDDGVRRAAHAAVDVALDGGAPDAAHALLAALRSPPPALVERIAAARGQVRAETAQLRAVARAVDLDIGRTLRLALLLTMTVVSSLGSVITHFLTLGRGIERTHADGLAWMSVLVVLTSVVVVATRRQQENVITRRFLHVLLAAVVGNLLARLSCLALGTPAVLADLVGMHIWWMGLTALAIAIDRSFLAFSVGYAGIIVLAVHWPAQRLLLSVPAHVLLFMNAWWAWPGPARAAARRARLAVIGRAADDGERGDRSR
jgi:serine/threonine-protein kinase